MRNACLVAAFSAIVATACSAGPGDEHQGSSRQGLTVSGDSCSCDEMGWCSYDDGYGDSFFDPFGTECDSSGYYDPWGGDLGSTTCGSTWQQIFGSSASTESEARASLDEAANQSCGFVRDCHLISHTLDEVACINSAGAWHCDGRLRCDYGR